MPALIAGSSSLLLVVAATAATMVLLVAVVPDCLAGHREVSVVVAPS